MILKLPQIQPLGALCPDRIVSDLSTVGSLCPLWVQLTVDRKYLKTKIGSSLTMLQTSDLFSFAT
jgi:hypothetical protein